MNDQLPARHDASVQSLVNAIVESNPEVMQLRADYDKLYKDNVDKSNQIKSLEKDLYRTRRMRDIWIGVANDMKVELKTIVNNAAAAADISANASITLANQAKEALKRAEERLAKDGLAMVEPSVKGPLNDEAMKKLGEAFGAGHGPIQP